VSQHTAESDASGYPVLDRDACRKCGREIVQVDLYGSAFFTHKPRRDCLTWWHVEQHRNVSHQAEPLRTARHAARVLPPEVGQP